MDEIADDSAAKVKECQGASPVLARNRCLQKEGGKHFPSLGSAVCQEALLIEQGLPGSTCNPFRITQPVVKMSDGYCDIYFTYCVGRDMKKKE